MMLEMGSNIIYLTRKRLIKESRDNRNSARIQIHCLAIISGTDVDLFRFSPLYVLVYKVYCLSVYVCNCFQGRCSGALYTYVFQSIEIARHTMVQIWMHGFAGIGKITLCSKFLTILFLGCFVLFLFFSSFTLSLIRSAFNDVCS